MRIVWLAAADARGHLMRAHLLRGLLRRAGIRVDVITTSEQGQAFLAALGTPAEVLSHHYGVAFDAWQNMARAKTERCVLEYLLRPSRAAADRRRLDEACEGAVYIVNDFHPLLLATQPSVCPVVHVYGENLWRAIEGNFEGRGPAFVDRGFGALMRRLRDWAHARIEHTLAAPSTGDLDAARRTYRLLPAVAAPQGSPAEVRAALGVGRDERLAAVYLNPHFSDPALAAAIELALRAEGFAMHAVGEGFAGRSGWRPYDPSFVDVVAAADVLVSAPGMGAVGHAKLLGTRLLALVTDQPEQRHNLRFLAGTGLGSAGAASRESALAVELASPLGLSDRIRLAAARLAAAPPRDRRAGAAPIAQVHARWIDALIGLAKSSPRASRRLLLSVPTLDHATEVQR